MRRILLFLYLLLTATTVRAALHGTWHARLEGDRSIHLSLVREHNQYGHNVAMSDVTGLTPAQLAARDDTPVRFTLTRAAGTLTLDGVFGEGEGGGRFTFNPNQRFGDEMKNLGVSWSDDLDDARLFMLAAVDVSPGFVRELQSIGYHVTLEDYTRFRIHGATADYVRELQSLGYRGLSAEELVRFRIHGVRGDYVRAMNDLGYHPSAEDIVKFRIHGVSPELVKTLTTLGYRNLSGDDLVRFKIHGVSSEYLRAIKDLGYTPSAEDLVRMRIHGVSPEFIRSLKDAGYSGIPVEKLIEMRIHGLDARYLKAMNR
jgi:hypothetical protein